MIEFSPQLVNALWSCWQYTARHLTEKYGSNWPETWVFKREEVAGTLGNAGQARLSDLVALGLLGRPNAADFPRFMVRGTDRPKQGYYMLNVAKVARFFDCELKVYARLRRTGPGEFTRDPADLMALGDPNWPGYDSSWLQDLQERVAAWAPTVID